VIQNPEALIAGFIEAALHTSLIQAPPALRHELLRAPHRPPSSLPAGQAAVYVFSLRTEYGSACPAGPNRVLKVGKVGPNSAPRFCSQHYNPGSSNSNLAKSLLNERVLWPFLGVTTLDALNVKAWMMTNIDRDHIFVPAGTNLEREVERYLRGWLGPAFEG
jgi:hypothetical protein